MAHRTGAGPGNPPTVRHGFIGATVDHEELVLAAPQIAIFQQWLLTCFDDEWDTVMFAPGAPFYGTAGKGVNEIRIAYILKCEELDRAMELLAKGIAKYQAQMM